MNHGKLTSYEASEIAKFHARMFEKLSKTAIDRGLASKIVEHKDTGLVSVVGGCGGGDWRDGFCKKLAAHMRGQGATTGDDCQFILVGGGFGTGADGVLAATTQMTLTFTSPCNFFPRRCILQIATITGLSPRADSGLAIESMQPATGSPYVFAAAGTPAPASAFSHDCNFPIALNAVPLSGGETVVAVVNYPGTSAGGANVNWGFEGVKL